MTLELEGEASEAGRRLAEQLVAAPPATALIAGGENTVTLESDRDVRPGGGPSQEAALAAALALDGHGRSCVLCLDSDGTDGPTDAAGGLVDDMTVAAARAGRCHLTGALARHEALAALAALGDLVVTGPTGTNVNDLKIGLKP